MARLVKCKVCGRRFSEDAARELRGKRCCPPCYEKLAAKLDEKKSAQSGSGPRPAAKPARPAWQAKPQPARPLAPSEKLARRAGMAPSSDAGGDELDLPDMPDDLGPESRPWRQRQRPGFGIGPATLGRGFYAALLAGGLYVGHRFATGGVALTLLGAAALIGAVALLLGLLEAVKGGERPRQVCGALAAAAGLFLAGWGGKTFYAKMGELDPIGDLVNAAGTQEPGAWRKEKLGAELEGLLIAAAREIRAANPQLVSLSAVRKDRFRKLEYRRRAAGPIKGRAEVEFARGLRTFPFEVCRVNRKWQIVSIQLPDAGQRAERGMAGKWRLVEMASSDVAVRYRRALRGLDAATLPAAGSGLEAGAKVLADYGRLRVKDGPLREISPSGAGMILALGRDTKFSKLLGMARHAKGYRRPLAVLVAGARGPIFPLPQITARAPQGQLKTVVVALRSGEGG